MYSLPTFSLFWACSKVLGLGLARTRYVAHGLLFALLSCSAHGNSILVGSFFLHERNRFMVGCMQEIASPMQARRSFLFCLLVSSVSLCYGWPEIVL